jgi:citrate lyase beta subunit
MQMAADKIELLKQIAKQFESLRLESGLEDGMMNIQLSRKKVETLALRPWISTISLACKEALDRESGE